MTPAKAIRGPLLEMMVRSGIGEFSIQLVGIKTDDGDAKIAGFAEELRFGKPAQFGSLAGGKTAQFKELEGEEESSLVLKSGRTFAQGERDAFVVWYGQGFHLGLFFELSIN